MQTISSYMGVPCTSAVMVRAGLSAPANSAVVTAAGADVTEQYRRGAEAALALARLYGCQAAVLKERSPSCGRGTIHDGGFSGGLTAGDGVTAELLEAAGIPVYGESRAEELAADLSEK